MPTPAPEPAHVDATISELHSHKGLAHLRVRKHGAALVIESGPTGDAVKHARLVRDGVSLWVLEIADHRGRWEYTGVREARAGAVTKLLGEFGWVLTDIASEIPDRTSDPKY
jgi:hypothetical protein